MIVIIVMTVYEISNSKDYINKIEKEEDNIDFDQLFDDFNDIYDDIMPYLDKNKIIVSKFLTKDLYKELKEYND